MSAVYTWVAGPIVVADVRAKDKLTSRQPVPARLRSTHGGQLTCAF